MKLLMGHFYSRIHFKPSARSDDYNLLIRIRKMLKYVSPILGAFRACYFSYYINIRGSDRSQEGFRTM